MLQPFGVVHLDGFSTRSPPYAERRALLKELALDGPAWRTPASPGRGGDDHRLRDAERHTPADDVAGHVVVWIVG
jgi:hypothetical protein